jgi:hypothetical protein
MLDLELIKIFPCYDIYKNYFNRLTDFSTFIKGFELYRLNLVKNVKKDLVKTYMSISDCLIGNVIEVDFSEKKEDNHVSIIDLKYIKNSICSCQNNVNKLCEHETALLIYCLFNKIIPEAYLLSINSEENKINAEWLDYNENPMY